MDNDDLVSCDEDAGWWWRANDVKEAHKHKENEPKCPHVTQAQETLLTQRRTANPIATSVLQHKPRFIRHSP